MAGRKTSALLHTDSADTYDARRDTGLEAWPADSDPEDSSDRRQIPPPEPTFDPQTKSRKRRRSMAIETSRSARPTPQNPQSPPPSASVSDGQQHAGSSVHTRSIPTTTSSTVWSKFDPGFEIDFGDGYFRWATDKLAPDTMVLVQHLDNVDRTRTADHLARLQNPYFVASYGVFAAGEATDVVFEHMRLSLTQIIAVPRALTEQEKLAIMAQLIRGLQAAEQVGISGFDLHPSRIWLNYQGEVKILPGVIRENSSGTFLTPSSSTGKIAGIQKDVHNLIDILQHLNIRPKLTTTSSLLTDDTKRDSVSDFVSLQSATVSGDLATVVKDPFLARPWNRTDLIELVQIACIRSKVYARDIHRFAE